MSKYLAHERAVEVVDEHVLGPVAVHHHALGRGDPVALGRRQVGEPRLYVVESVVSVSMLVVIRAIALRGQVGQPRLQLGE